MPQVNLSTLTPQELRQRLDSSRARGDATLAYEILREMAVRREAGAERRAFSKRRAASPHLVEVDLGDPLEKPADEIPDMPNWVPGTEEGIGPVAAPENEHDFGPLTLVGQPETTSDRAAADEALGLHLSRPEPTRPEPKPRAPTSRMGLGMLIGLVLGVFAGLAGGWLAASWVVPDASTSVEVAAVDAPPPPAAPLPVTVAEPAAAAPETALLDTGPEPPLAEEGPVPSPDAVDAAPAAAPEPELVSATDPCAAEPTPADRVICGDADLQRLQRDLREAYADALEAHVERALLRQRQLAWRDARSTVADPARLARLYEQRIQKLHAAAAEARAQR